MSKLLLQIITGAFDTPTSTHLEKHIFVAEKVITMRSLTICRRTSIEEHASALVALQNMSAR